MSARWWTLLVWALVAGSALAWGLRLGNRPTPVPPQALVVEPGPTPPAGGDFDRVLGARAAPAAASAPLPAADARFALLGVVSPRAAAAAREGVALIAVDGKPARPLRVGATLEGVDGGWRLRSVSPHAAVLAADGRELRLEMPALARRSSAGDAVAPPRPPLPGQPAPGIPAAPLVPPTPPLPTTPPLSATPAPVLPVAPAVTPQPQAFVPPSAARND